MKYAVAEKFAGHAIEYITTNSGNWLDLLNETSKNKNDAYKYNTKKEAEEAMLKFIKDAGDMYNGALLVKGIR